MEALITSAQKFAHRHSSADFKALLASFLIKNGKKPMTSTGFLLLDRFI